MSNERVQHQQSSTGYQIRINWEPVRWSVSLDSDVIDEYSKLCSENIGEYVDIVAIRTEILMNQHTYNQMKKHFARK